jgi:protein-arginine kinase activator protein McsA
MICENCNQNEASIQMRDMNGKVVNICGTCAQGLQGVDIQSVDEE